MTEKHENGYGYQIISNILYYPIKRDAEYAYSVADALVGKSNEYAKRAVKYNKQNISIYTITAIFNYFEDTRIGVFSKKTLQKNVISLFICI